MVQKGGYLRNCMLTAEGPLQFLKSGLELVLSVTLELTSKLTLKLTLRLTYKSTSILTIRENQIDHQTMEFKLKRTLT